MFVMSKRMLIVMSMLFLTGMAECGVLNISEGGISDHSDAAVMGSMAWFFSTFGSGHTYKLVTPAEQGVYKIMNTLTMPIDSVLISDADAKIQAQEGLRLAQINTLMIKMSDNCELSGLIIDANRNASIAVSAIKCKNVKVLNCQIRDTRNYYENGFDGRSHIIHAYYVDGLTIKDCVLENAGCNPKVGPKDWPGQASAIDAAWGNNIIVENNKIDYALGHGVTFLGAKNVTVHNNRIWHTGENARIPIGQTGDGIGAYHNGLGDEWLNWNITDNDIQFYGNHGIHISGRGIRLTGNHINEGQYTGISVQDWRDPHDSTYDVWIIDNYVGGHGTGMSAPPSFRFPILVYMGSKPGGIVIEGTKGNTDVYWGEGTTGKTSNDSDTLIPVRQGISGVRPFWNEHAFRFMNVPAFDFKTVDDAVEYKFTAVSQNGQTYSFLSKRPDSLLSPVWLDIPVGLVTLKVEGIDKEGKVIGVAGERKFEKAARYAGPYRQGEYDYSKSATMALEKLYKKDFITNWLKTGEPDPKYHYRYRYAAKMISGVIEGAVVYAKINPKPADADEVLKIGVAAGDYLLTRLYPVGSPLEYFPPTYDKMEAEGHMDVNKCMFMYGVEVGQAYLGLFELTKDKKYFDAAERIADGFKRLQLDNGTWYLVVDVKTGKPVNDNYVNPPLIVNYLDTFIKKYNRGDLQSVVDKAVKWTFENPMRTFNWQNQFEDSPPDKPYKNLSHVEPCLFAIYLLENASKNSVYIEQAQELIRFVEDQFVVWSNPPADSNRNWDNALYPAEYYATDKWVLPCVCEQYLFWQPVGAASANLISVLKKAYQVTGQELYLTKAKDLANNIVHVQEKYHKGEYLTYLTTLERDYWVNCTVHTAKVMFEFN